MESKAIYNSDKSIYTQSSVETDSDIFIVTRGKQMEPVSTVSRMFTLINACKYKHPEVDSLARNIREAKLDYSGSFHSNYFRVDRAIELIDVGFFGPHSVEEAEYFVHIELFEPKDRKEIFPECNSPRIGKRKCTVIAKQDTIFYIGFEKSIRIEPHVWYLIQFMLNGPPTFRCEKTRRCVQVAAYETNVKFEFNVGSKQMPSLRFRLLKY